MNESTNNPDTQKPRRRGKGFKAVVLIAVVASVSATAIWAGGHRFGHGGWDSAERIPFVVERMTRRLDLTETQQTNIEARLTAGQTAAEPYREQLSALRTDMRELVEADAFYEDQVRIQLESKADAMVELMVIGARTMHDVRAELTPEQRAEADEFMHKLIDRGGRRGWRHEQANEEI